nr:S-layer homology domain-containing protein [uncultured Oscillibacter sp.]
MMANARAQRAFVPGFARLAALVLAALTLCAALSARPAQAAEWMEPYLEQVREWGVMRGDASGNMNADREITRAEFVTLVNRAFGYTEVGPHTFTDVAPNDWFAEDISIAHQAGYFNGTSPTTASPMSPVTREQAAVLLGRSLRLQGVTGAANSTFTDMQDIGGWSRGLVQEAADLGIVQGYPDGSFRPGQYITRGQMACFLVRALGTLVQEPGEQASGGVYGNLTINAPGVKLKDTTITGNLYLTGGVGLGNVELENVTVLGKIVLCGAGEAERGDHSVILRNVTAGTLEVDSLTDQFLSVQAEGLTSIDNTIVRTSAYLEDLTEDGLGLKSIRLDGEDGVQLQLAGNIKDVTNLTPNSALQIAQGVAGTVTVDERATNTTLSIDNRAIINNLNLDAGTPVTGAGSVSHLNINAPGSNVSMLPDTITVRPGITGNINNQNMNNISAAESSEEPRLLAGYPVARNVAPTSADAVFSTNKQGTIHWAITALMDGSLGEEELMNPSAYSAKIIRSGTVAAANSNTEYTARLTGLTREGSYYISALVVDARGHRSPVKVAAFTTPDDSTPNFATGYPQEPVLTVDADGEQVAQIMVMPTKDCQMYYVLLPSGATAPTAADFRSAALPGNLGFGIVRLRKNTPFLVSRINSSHLQEQTTYNLYLWLNDADNGRSSAVRRVQITTRDLTPPTIQHLTVTNIAAQQVQLSFALDEPGMLYWAVVRQGTSFYASGIDKENPGLAGQIQIENGTGTNVVRRGGPIRANQASTDVTFTVAGLQPQTAYDLYYVAKDLAGNYCVYSQTLTPPMEINTLDNEAPTVTQEFTNDGDGPESHPTPYPDSTIRLVFSEVVLAARNEAGEWKYDSFEDAWRDAQGGSAEKQKVFADLLREHIKLYRRPAMGQPQLVTERTADNESTIGDSWVIDYRKAVVQRDPSGSGEMYITFPYEEDRGRSALNLGSGETYYFVVSNVADNSDAHNRLQNSAGNREGFQLPDFTTIDARLHITAGTAMGTVGGQNMVFDMNFRLSPEGTANVNSEVLWDMIFWADESLAFKLYCNDGSGWRQLGGEAEIHTNAQQPRTGISITKLLLGSSGGVPNFEQLNQVSGVRDYGIMITRRGDSTERDTWSGDVTLTIMPVAGDLNSLTNLAGKNLTPSAYQAHQNSNYAVREIGIPREYQVSKPFADTQMPTFIENYPRFTPTDSGVSIDLMASRDNCKYFCVVTRVNNIPTTLDDGSANAGTPITLDTWRLLPQSGGELRDANGLNPQAPGNVNPPSTTSITNGTTYVGPSYIIRNGSCGRRVTNINITASDPEGGLDANSEYVAYFVLQGDDPTSASKVYAFRFQTEAVTRPVLSVTLNSPMGIIQSNREADVWYALVTAGTTQAPFNLTLADCAPGNPNWDSNSAAQASYGTLSVLEAMRMEAPSGMTGSLFDAFANLDNSNTMAIVNVVKSSGSSAGSIPIAAGPVNLNSQNNLRTSVNFSQYLVGNAEYWLVAVGQCQGTSGHAFRSNRYLRNTDTTPPQVTALDTNISSGTIYTVDDRQLAYTERYSGTLYITFSEALYYRESAEVRKQIIDAQNVADPQNRYMSSVALLGSNNPNFHMLCRVTNFNPNNPQDCMDLRIQFENCGDGDSVTFDANLCDVNNNPGSRPLTLTLRLVEENGLLRPKFEFASTAIAGIWDGRTNVRN